MDNEDGKIIKVRRESNQELDRRLATRLIEIVARLAEQHVQLAALAPRVIPAAQAYIELYDAGALRDADRRQEIERRDEGVADLHRATRGWVAVMLGDVAGFFDDYDADPRVATDVLADAERLMGLVRARAGADGESLPYAQQLLTSIEAKVDAVGATAGEAHRARVGTQEHQARLREAQAELRKQLVGVRRVLRVLVGTSSLDYQRLRLARIDVVAPDPEVNEAASPIASDTVDEPSGVHDLPADTDTAVNQ